MQEISEKTSFSDIFQINHSGLNVIKVNCSSDSKSTENVYNI